MARRRRLKSISVPITLGAVTVSLAAALLVGWSILVGQRIATSEAIGGPVSLLVLGAVSFVVIMTVLVLLSVYLAREILEVRRQNSFVDSVTHELKSPLASLKLFLETLGRPEIADPQREELRRMMLDDVARLSSFIDDVLQASRLSHDDIAMEADEVDLAEAARASAVEVAARYRLRGDAIDVRIPEGTVLTTDRAALSIVLKNLVDNAVKYSDGDVAVSITAGVDRSGRMEIAVRDRGIGIERKHLRRVFHRFYRVQAEAARRRGTGLGLFVAGALVRNLGGRIRAFSEGPGKGTTMRVTLPHGKPAWRRVAVLAALGRDDGDPAARGAGKATSGLASNARATDAGAPGTGARPTGEGAA